MRRAYLLMLTALLEVATAALLLLVPAVPLGLLLGVELAAPETLLVARIAGVALLAIGVACWQARHHERSAARDGLLIGVLIYDVGAAGLLAYAGLGLGLVGMALWPAVGLHAALAVWCSASFRVGQPAGKHTR
jgi:hypothetical protein